MAARAGKAERRKDRRIVIENVRRMPLKEYLMKETHRAGFGGLGIQRSAMGTRVALIAERPGLVIGRKGSSIKSLTDAVARDFNFDNPQIEVQEVENPALNAQIMAEKLSNALERGWHFRRAGHSTLRRIMESGAKGCLIVIAGKLTGQRHRTVKFKAGHVKYCGEPRNPWRRVRVGRRGRSPSGARVPGGGAAAAPGAGASPPWIKTPPPAEAAVVKGKIAQRKLK